jgi:hypothetical protein
LKLEMRTPMLVHTQDRWRAQALHPDPTPKIRPRDPSQRAVLACLASGITAIYREGRPVRSVRHVLDTTHDSLARLGRGAGSARHDDRAVAVKSEQSLYPLVVGRHRGVQPPAFSSDPASRSRFAYGRASVLASSSDHPESLSDGARARGGRSGQAIQIGSGAIHVRAPP